MNDRPTVPELIAAARVFLEQELLPALADARLRFQTLVAANVLAICERELLDEEDHLAEEWQRLGALLDLADVAPERLSMQREITRERNTLLCQQIRAGDFDEPGRFRELCRQLRRAVERKLEVANPKYLAGFRGESSARQ